jgi:hypothetical protein
LLVNFTSATKTSSSGRYQVSFTIDYPELNNKDEFPVEFRFAKRTGTVNHRFLCNEGTRDCTATLVNVTVGNITSEIGSGNASSTTTLYIRHLDFDSPMKVIDDTTVPFQGKVTVYGTESSPSSGLFCPLLNAKVCLKDHNARNTYTTLSSTCTTTDPNGFYSLPAVIGTKVSPYVDYNNHTFRAINSIHEIAFVEGIEIRGSVVYNGYNLEDITIANITLDVSRPQMLSSSSSQPWHILFNAILFHHIY